MGVTPMEYAYVAGFFDGEGTVMITRRKASRAAFSDNHQIWIGCAQRIDHRDVIDDIQAMFGGSVRVLNRNKVNPKWADIAQWELIARKEQRQFLSAMLAHGLRVKRAHALLAIEFLDVVEAYGRDWRRTDSGARFNGTRPLTTEQIAVREDFRQRMAFLNRVGPR